MREEKNIVLIVNRVLEELKVLINGGCKAISSFRQKSQRGGI